ncbi:hypothetical protein [Leucobacter soli]|uniref:hypothetical protein n=1 Tax=Leucobacter soli TaxID=2812850 RepID=UPI0036064A56
MTITTPNRRTGRLSRAAAATTAILALSGLVACSSTSVADDTAPTTPDAATASPFDLTSANAESRPRIDPIPEAVAALEASGFSPVDAGKLTVANGAFVPPSASWRRTITRRCSAGTPTSLSSSPTASVSSTVRRTWPGRTGPSASNRASTMS